MIIIKFNDDITHTYNSFEEILKLENYNDIILMNCNNNNLSNLPKLPNSLQILQCYNNKISSLPELPNSLTYLWCDNNILFSLPELPNSLKYLSCFNNKISKLPELPNSIVHINYYSNPIYRYIEKYFDGNEKKYIEYDKNMKRQFANKLGDWYLDCKYNPKYLYCRKRLMKEYEELYN